MRGGNERFGEGSIRIRGIKGSIGIEAEKRMTRIGATPTCVILNLIQDPGV